MNELERDMVIARNMMAVARRSRKGKSANIRSKMLKMIMPHLSRDTGDRLADAISKNDSSEFSAVWDKIKHEISDKLGKGKHSANASAEVEGAVTPITIDILKQYVTDSTSGNLTDFLTELGESVASEMESTSTDYDYHDYGNVLLGKGNNVKTREFVANGSCQIEGKEGTLTLLTTSIKVLTNTDLLKNIELEVTAQLLDVNKVVVRTYRERGCMAVAATEIILKALSLARL